MVRYAAMTMVLVCGFGLAIPGALAGRGGSHGRGPSGRFHGTITRVAGNTVAIAVEKDADGAGEQEKVVTFWTDKETQITGDGKPGTIADLHAGQDVMLKARDGKANSIEVSIKPTSRPTTRASRAARAGGAGSEGRPTTRPGRGGPEPKD